jgi:hypothetical protein
MIREFHIGPVPLVCRPLLIRPQTPILIPGLKADLFEPQRHPSLPRAGKPHSPFGAAGFRVSNSRSSAQRQ